MLPQEIRLSFLILVLAFLSIQGISQSIGDTLHLRGSIGNSFLFATSYKLNLKERTKILQDLSAYTDKIPLLDKYHILQNNSQVKEAEDLLQSDSTLSQMNSMGIGLLYMTAKFRELDILFHPLIMCYGSDYLIHCEVKQIEELIPSLNKNEEWHLIVTYTATILTDNTEIVKLIDYYPHEKE